MSIAAPTAIASAEGQAGDGPLAGIRVLDLATVYAAPVTAMLLGDHGADVLKRAATPRERTARAGTVTGCGGRSSRGTSGRRRSSSAG